MKPQVAVVVDVVERMVDVGVVVVDVETLVVVGAVVVVVVSTVPGADPQPTRVAETRMLSNLPPMVVPAPPKLSTPKPIQSRLCGNCRPDGTLEPIFCGESQVTGLPAT